jgi:hypothetical protein
MPRSLRSAGEINLEIDQLEYPLSISAGVSGPYLELKSDFEPKRVRPRFQAPIEKHEEVDGAWGSIIGAKKQPRFGHTSC